MSDDYKIQPLGDHHNRAAFSCGDESLDQYFKTQASQAMDKNLAAVFVLTQGTTIAGFYTLSQYAIKLDEIPEEIKKKLTRMPLVPATLIGRLARDVNFQGKGIGEILLADAVQRAFRISREAASWAIIVDSKNDNATKFYQKFGFLTLPTNPTRLFLPMESAAEFA